MKRQIRMMATAIRHIDQIDPLRHFHRFHDFIAVIAPIALSGGVALNATGAGVYTAAVPAGITNSLEQAFANGYVTSTDETASLKGLYAAADLRITGAGRLNLDANLDGNGFTGEVHVVKGARACLMANGALGDTLHGTFVEDGATLENLCTDASANSKLDFSGEPLTFAGSGVDGLGALVALTPVKQERNGVWGGTKLTMTGDATIAAVTGYQDFPNNSANNSLDMNGHTLTITGYRGVSTTGGFCFRAVISNPGHIIARHCPLSINDFADLGGSAENTLTLTDWSKLELYTCTKFGRRRWTLIATDTASTTPIQTSNLGGIWDGPIRFAKASEIDLWNQDDKISNPQFLGSITTPKDLTFKNISKTDGQPSVTLAGDDSAIGGAVKVIGADLVINSAGALPKTTPSLFMQGGNISFSNSVTNFDLPDLVTTNALTIGAGQGALKSLTKKGSGELTYNEGLTPASLDLQDGSFKMVGDAEKNLRAFYAGLHYGYDTNFNIWWNDPDSGVTNIWASRAVNEWKKATVVTNSVVTDLSELKNIRKALSATYFTGYIMNNEPTNVTWRFASSMNLIACLIINGIYLGKQPDGKITAFFNATLKPGANSFDYRVSTTLVRSIRTDATNCTSWARGYGFAVCKTSTTSTDDADFEELSDPGDGSVFRRFVEGTPGWIGAEAAWSNDVQAIDSVTTYDGASVEMGGTSWQVERLVGLPKITCEKATYRPTPLFKVMKAWQVDAESLIAGKSLVCAPAFAFDPAAKIELAHSKKLRGKGAVVALTSEAKITGLPEVACDDGGHAEAIVSADGKTLSLRYVPKGLAIIVK